jgi:hypothetical protein
MVISALVHDPVVHLAIACCLALMLALSAIHKLLDLHTFGRVLGGYQIALKGLLPERLTPVLLVVLPLLELVASAGLIASFWVPASAFVAVALLALYAGVLGLSVAYGAAMDDCGCHFGIARQPLGAGLVWRNLALVSLAAHLLVPATGRPLGWVDLITLMFSIVGAAALYLVTNLLIHNRVFLRELQ